MTALARIARGWMAPARIARVCGALLVPLCACGKPAEQEAPAAAPEAPPAAPAPAAAEPAATPAPDTGEACGQIIVVSYKGAAHAKPGVTRSKAEAEQRARELGAKLQSGADFAALAQAESDAPSSAPRGGVMGTYAKAEWPELHQKLRDPLFALHVGEVAPQAIDADYGYVLVRRCAVEKAHARHILVRYKGAKNAEGVTRDKAAAKQRATDLLAKLTAGADFAALAKTESEDGSSARGGDVGNRGRGVLALPFEQALFALQPGQRSGVIESEFGFHIVERLPD